LPIDLTPDQKRYEARLTQEDAKAAIYIDFEGFMKKPPTLMGYCCDRHFVQVVFDRTLQSAASAKNLLVQEGQTAVANLLRRAKDEGRRIVAFSQFDKNASFDELGVDLSPVYADARLIARRWLNEVKRRYPNWHKTNPHWDSALPCPLDRPIEAVVSLLPSNLRAAQTSDLAVFTARTSSCPAHVLRMFVLFMKLKQRIAG
jgi:hypothetical protein